MAKMESAKISVILLLLLVVSTYCFHSRIIIVEDAKACFRRALAGKRVTRSLIRKAVPCERIEDCQLECSEEKRFVCEGFNYRLDPSGRGNGDCELLDLPMVRLNMGRDIYSDPDYDIYEKDRNSRPDCKGDRPMTLEDRYREDRYRDRDRRPDYDRYENRRYDRFPDRDEHHRDRDRPPYYDDRRYGDRRGDGNYYNHRDEHRHSSHYSGGDKYLPKPHYQPPPYLPKRPVQSHYAPTDKYHGDDERDMHQWGLDKGSGWGSYGGLYGNFGRPHYGYVQKIDNNRRNYYLPNRVGGSPDWGTYGGSYGTGGHGPMDRYDVKGSSYGGGSYLPNRPQSYIPTSRPPPQPFDYGVHRPSMEIAPPIYDGFKPSYGPTHHHKQPDFDRGYNYPRPNYNNHRIPIMENDFPPTNGDTVEHKKFELPKGHVGYNFLKDECSLRTGTGFRLHKTIVQKQGPVENIHECEMLCFKEVQFECLSYAYRYTVSANSPSDNCYLSSKNYKALDYYTDLEPDREFDIYTMNNRKMCNGMMSPGKDQNSDCFWHTRSGHRLEEQIVLHSVNVRSIVECQIECLHSMKFLCRGFSFRYGSPTIGGPDNCLLTDWPFMELNPKTQFVPDPGFETYERGSFGHGCEPNHFSIRGKEPPVIGSKTDQLCYVGYGQPARLLPAATRKSLFVNSELDCKAECTNTRHQTLFQCMSFSFKTKAQRGETNCDLSDILQRDLLSNVDYVEDPDSWLFAWDNYNPECVALIDSNQIASPNYIGRDDFMDISRYGGYDPMTALDTWRVYSVSGWPCRRGSLCKENREAGFWFCELEGGDADTWDYCCRPDHQCGYSQGYSYQWCYVGPERTQWRKCSDRYYPYIFNLIDRHQHNPEYRPKPYLPHYNPNVDGDVPPFIKIRPPSNSFAPRPGFRPDRPKARPRPPHRKPSLNEYESAFDMQFLDPPKPGGFGPSRYWPVSYLHKETPPNVNATEHKYDQMKMPKNMERDNRLVAIHNLIEIIKSNDINNIQYQIQNKSKTDDILLVKIPLPTNFTEEKPTNKSDQPNKEGEKPSKSEDAKNKSSPGIKIKDTGNRRKQSTDNAKSSSNISVREAPLYRRSYITRTNVTNHGRHVFEAESVQLD